MSIAGGVQHPDTQAADGTVMVIGVFDLFHRGHVEFLRRAAGFGDRVVVIVNGDDMVSRYKRRPVFSETDRLEIVKALKWVDDAVVAHDFDVKPFVQRFRPSVIVHGDDWPRESYLAQIRMTEQDLVKYDVSLEFIPYYAGATTSEIIRTIQGILRE